MRGILIVLVAGCGRFGFGPSDGAATARGCVKQLTAYGDQVCALRSDGALYCWGGNGAGQLGDGTFIDHLLPAPAMIADVAVVTSGEDTVCAARSDGTLWCWGQNNDGQVGDGSLTNQPLPVHVPLQASVRTAVAAQTHTCAVLADDTGWCWGYNMFGELGYDLPTMQTTPAGSPIAGNTAVTLGDNLTCVLRADSSVACFGRDDEGELGDGLTTSRSTAMKVAAIVDPVISVAGGCHRHVCAATAVGDVWCWGENMHGEIGTGMMSPFEATPVRVAGVTDAVQVAVGAFHSCARTQAGEIWCWGDNDDGELGDGTQNTSYVPVRVAGLTGKPIDLQAPCGNTVALRDDGTIVAWGAAGLLGTGDAIDALTPVETPIPCP